MFSQLLTPVADSLGLSFLVAILPIVALLVLLGVLRRPGWQAALAGLAVGLIVAIGVWKMPVELAFNSVLNGAVFALWPVMWIVVNALLLYNIAEFKISGREYSVESLLFHIFSGSRDSFRCVYVIIGMVWM